MSEQIRVAILNLLLSQQNKMIQTKERLDCLLYRVNENYDGLELDFDTSVGLGSDFPDIKLVNRKRILSDLTEEGLIQRSDKEVIRTGILVRKKPIIQREEYRITGEGKEYIRRQSERYPNLIKVSQEVGEKYGNYPVSNLIQETVEINANI